MTSLNEIIANSKNMREFDTSKNKNKQRRSEDMYNQNAGIDSSQIQKAESNHESYLEASQSQSLSAEMKARIVELMQQTLFTFMKAQAHNSASHSESSISIEDRSSSRSSSYEHASVSKWNSSNIEFFDSHFNEKITAIAFAMKHSDKNTYYRDIHFFLERCSNIVTVKDEQLVRENLFICLRELTLQWYISEMTSDAKTLVKYAFEIQHWFAKLLEKFKKRSNVALVTLMKEKYTFENVRKQRESREYASIILRAAKFTNLAVSDQISMIWNELDAKFQRDIRRSFETTIINDFLNSLDEFKDIWWQLARRRMFLSFENAGSYRIDQYQSSENTARSYGNIFGSSEYRKDYTQRSNYFAYTYSNNSNRQQFTSRSWSYQKIPNTYRSIKQFFQSDQRDRQMLKDIVNSREFSKTTDINKPQHSIYNKIQRYTTNSSYFNASYQQKAYHEKETKIPDEFEETEDQENLFANFADLDEEGHELYYEKQTIKNEDNETFVGFIEIESICKRCEKSFFSKNLLHNHIRKKICLKLLSEISKIKTSDMIKIVTSTTATENQDFELRFRSWNFLQAFVKLIFSMKAILICLDTDCEATLADKSWILDILSNVQIKKMKTALMIKNIDPTIHESIEFICILIYFSGKIENDTAALAFIIREIHLVEHLKTKMLIENDFLDSKEFVINIEDKVVAIESCKMNISLKIQSKDSYIRRTVHAQNVFILQSEMKQFISIKTKIFEERDFFFESDSNANFTMCSQILNANTKKILIRNESEIIIKISRRKRFEQISKVDCDNCFQMTEIDMTIKSSKQKNKVLSTVNIFSIISTDGLTSMKTKLLNDFMMYENTKAKKVYIKLIDEFSSLWENHDFIDVSETNWMKISLKDNWQSKVIEKFKIYPLNTKDKEVLDKTFDDLHEKNRLKWTDKTTPFSYSVFIAWRTINEIRKNRAIVDIRELNDLIVSDAYSMLSQSEIINDLKDCTHIFVLDASFFFYQWRMHSNDTYKLTVVTHRRQEIFLVSVMNCRNSVVYVQRQMNILLRQLQAFVKAYIDDIVIRSKSLSEHLHHLHQLFSLFVKRNINLNLIKIFLSYFEVTLLKQRVNAFDLSIIENRLKVLTSLTISETFAKLETYLELIDYIRHYIHFYVSISRSFQDLKTSLLKIELRNDVKRKIYTSKTKLFLTSKEKKSFKALQKAFSNVSILIHFNFKKVLWIDLNESKEHEFEIMIFHLRDEIA